SYFFFIVVPSLLRPEALFKLFFSLVKYFFMISALSKQILFIVLLTLFKSTSAYLWSCIRNSPWLSKKVSISTCKSALRGLFCKSSWRCAKMNGDLVTIVVALVLGDLVTKVVVVVLAEDIVE
uniref:Uncharacterized 13.8 kDa protein n=1 Tax=Claviceps purpurea TaxID=5111 RepID=YPC3_CLAPU|nr:RecName: Full=Uncharacterized 13.8 kDa protein; AltName: Full=ORF3 [Claviceps purpurea]